MARHAFIIGGTGQIGRALAVRLLAAGWDVTISHRGQRGIPAELAESGARFVVLDRADPQALPRALAGGADAVIDNIAFDETHADQLLALRGQVGSLVVMSSISVYADAQGRTLDEARQEDDFPQMPDPIPESHRTIGPGPQTYSTRKVALELTLLDQTHMPVTILRPGAIYGPGALHPREWWFVKRLLDRRPRIPLAFKGESRFSATSVANLAALTLTVLENPATRILNAVDPDTPTVRERGAAIARHMDVACEFVLLGKQSPDSVVGSNPWGVPAPFVADDSASRALGYIPVETYAEGIRPICDWLIETSAAADWRKEFPDIARYDPFDYAAEDAALGGADGLEFDFPKQTQNKNVHF